MISTIQRLDSATQRLDSAIQRMNTTIQRMNTTIQQIFHPFINFPLRSVPETNVTVAGLKTLLPTATIVV